MASNSVSSEEFSFPEIVSQDSPHRSGFDSPPLWKHSPENYNRSFARLLIGKDDGKDQTKSFSCVEMRSRWGDTTENKMDMLWEDLNEELPARSQSLRIEPGGEDREKKLSVFSDGIAGGCGMKLSKKMPLRKKKSPNVLMLMRVLRKLLVLRSLSQRSPTKTHPRRSQRLNCELGGFCRLHKL